jgi:hypothetical protein
MKSIAIVLALTSFAACGTQESSLLSSGFKSRVFSHDARPADGALTEVTIASQKGTKKFDITLLTAIVDRRTGKPSEVTEVIGSSLDCTFKPTKIECRNDKRPADGVLTEITLIKDSNTWTASLRTVFFDRLKGKEIDETQIIETRLTERK